MRTAIARAVILLSLMATTLGQARPDFSGKWTETGVATGEVPTVMTVTQDANAITVDVPSRTATLRWIFKLDGSESKNVTIQGNTPSPVEQVSTAAWEGNRLVISTRAGSNREGPSTIRQQWALQAGNLIITTTQVSQTTGATLRESKQTFSK
jgi:hypothetical protein